MQSLDALSGVVAAERQRLLRWFGRLPEPQQIVVVQRQTDLMRRRQRGEADQHIFALAMLVRACVQFRQHDMALCRRRTMDKEALADLDRFRRAALVRRRPGRPPGKVAQFVAANYDLLNQLRQEGLSWQAISLYVATRHRKRMSHNALFMNFRRRQALMTEE